MTGGLDGLDRPSAAGAFDHPDQRDAVFAGHVFRHLILVLDRSVGRSAADGEVIAEHDDRSAIDTAATEDAIGGHEAGHGALAGIVGRLAGYRADLEEGRRVEQVVDALAYREPAAGVLP